MANPYNGDDYSHTAWENGRKANKAEQAEIVSELVEAAESARALLMIQAAAQPELLDSDGFRWLKSRLEKAIAKAKGE